MEEKKKIEYDRIFRALGDKHRLYILDLLMEKDRNAGELLELVDVVQSTLSHHMKALCESGLVIPRRERKWTYYTVSHEVVAEARTFLEKYLARESYLPEDWQKAEAESTERIDTETLEAAVEQEAVVELEAEEAVGEQTETEVPEAVGEITLYANMKSLKKKKTEKGKKDSEKKKSSGKKKEKKDKKDSVKKETDKKKTAKKEKKASKKEIEAEE